MSPDEKKEEYVNLQGAADLVGIGATAVRYWIITGLLPAERDGSRWRIKKSDVYAADAAAKSKPRAGLRGPRGKLIRPPQEQQTVAG